MYTLKCVTQIISLVHVDADWHKHPRRSSTTPKGTTNTPWWHWSPSRPACAAPQTLLRKTASVMCESALGVHWASKCSRSKSVWAAWDVTEKLKSTKCCCCEGGYFLWNNVLMAFMDWRTSTWTPGPTVSTKTLHCSHDWCLLLHSWFWCCGWSVYLAP